MQRTKSESSTRLQRRPSWRSGLRGGLWREASQRLPQLKEPVPRARAAKHRMAISEVAELNKARQLG